MKLPLFPLMGLVGVIACNCQIAIADTSLADKSLAHVQAKTSPALIKTTTIKPQKSILLLKPVSTLDKFITTAQALGQGGGVLGKNIKTVIRRDIVGIQYSAQW